MGAWRNWFHVSGTTYGQWLPGDPRGWRERRHRKHVDGDYKNPPPKGSGDKTLQRSKSLLKIPPVRLSKAQRQDTGRCLVEMFLRDEIQLLSLSMDAIHYHALIQYTDDRPRWWTGRAKKHAYHVLHKRWGFRKVWAKACNVEPVADRNHQVRVYHYILKHVRKGAWTWSYREGLYWYEAQDA